MTRVGRDRLRHQLDPPAGRRRRPGRAGATLVDLDRRMEIVRLGQGVDRTGRARARGASSAPWRWRPSTPTQCRELGVGAAAVRRDLRHPGRQQPRRVRRRRPRAARRRARGRHRRTRRPRCPSPARPCEPAGARRAPAPSWWSTSAAARPSSCAATDDVGRGRAVGRHRLRPADRAAPARRPADRRRGRRRPAPTSAPRSTEVAEVVALRGVRTLVGLAGSVTTVTAAGAAGCPRTTPRGSTAPQLPVDAGASRPATELLHHDPRASARRCRTCTRAGSTSSAPARWSGAR